MTITAFKRTLLTYLTALLDWLASDRCLDPADHPLLPSDSSMVIGSLCPMIGREPIGLWGLSKRFVATASGLIGVIDRFRVG
jgi:hypothetical protein